MEYLLIVLALVLVFILVAFFASCESKEDKVKYQKKRAERNAYEAKLNKDIEDLCERKELNIKYDYFTPVFWDKIGCCITKTGIAFIEYSESIGVKCYEYPYNSILGYELKWNETVSSGNGKIRRDGTVKIGRAVAGAVVAGPVGAIVGGLSGKRNDEYVKTAPGKTFSKMRLLIAVDDIDNPLYEIPFMNFALARKWESYFEDLAKIRRMSR
ncbi:MAG: hypothetical protein J7L25_05000 [Deltaproteobacteria bacterium]|nr:hypothetical protein [Candidatus Tharpella aukensis]